MPFSFVAIGMMVADVNSSLRCLPARHCCTDGHCMRPLNLLDVPSARHRVWDEMMPLEILRSEKASLSLSRCDDDS